MAGSEMYLKILKIVISIENLTTKVIYCCELVSWQSFVLFFVISIFCGNADLTTVSQA